VANVIFQGQVLGQLMRVVDLGAGLTPRLIVESQQPPDAMGGHGWAPNDPITRATFEALLIAAHIVT
jgi:hypothetical protein